MVSCSVKMILWCLSVDLFKLLRHRVVLCAEVLALPYLCYLEEMVNGACAILEEVNDECGLCSGREVSLKYYCRELLLFKELLYIKHYSKEPQKNRIMPISKLLFNNGVSS